MVSLRTCPFDSRIVFTGVEPWGTGGRGDGGTGGRGDGGTGGRVPPLVKAGGGGIFNLCKLPVAQSWGLGRQDKFALGSDESKSTKIFIR